MSKWQDDLYMSHKVETIMLIMVAAAIGFLWKFLPEIIPFVESKQISGIYTAKIVSCLGVVLVALGSYIIYLRKIPKYNRLTQAAAEDNQRKILGVFVLDEIERTKKEHKELLKLPTPTSETAFAQMREHGKFLEGQDEMLMRISQYIKPPG
mgnify:CR=1 FL=1